jgi:hypothetical protein
MWRVLAMGAVALLPACSGVPARTDAVTATGPDSYVIEAHGTWLAPQIRPTLDAAVAHCAGSGRQTAVQSSIIAQDRYTVRFSCTEPLEAPRRLVLDGQRGRAPGAPVTQAVLIPSEAPAPSIVVSSQPHALAATAQPLRPTETSAADLAPAAEPPQSARALPPIASGTPGAAMGLTATPPSSFWLPAR